MKRISRWFASPHLVPLGLIAVSVVAANLASLAGWVTTNPVQLFAGLNAGSGHSLAPGVPILDPNAGFITQSLGHLAVSDWFRGRVPWWNPFEGLGSPLAGEMQSAAFLPLIVLLEAPKGYLLLHMALEFLAGAATYFLLRRLDVTVTAATAGGIAFGLCGTLAWFGHAPDNPVPFLPLALLGIERAVAASREGRPGGWRLLAAALALSVAGGFPEVAYLDGLLVAVWAIVRLASRENLPSALLKKLGAGVAGGLALAAPVIVAFADYLGYSDVGGHTGSLATQAQPLQNLGQLLLPYAAGSIMGYQNKAGTLGPHAWAATGGYLGAGLAACAAVGLLGVYRGTHRALRAVLGAWIGLWMAKTYGAAPVVTAVNAVPGMHVVFSARFSLPSWELATTVLAALGIDDIATRRARLGAVTACVALTLAGVWGAASEGSTLLAHAIGGGHRQLWPLVSGAGAAVVALAVLASGVVSSLERRRDPGARRALRNEGRVQPGRAVGAAIAASAVAVEAVLLAAAPLLSAPRPMASDTSLVRFLQANAGTHRIYTLGPLEPNFGSLYGISELDVNDLPIPEAFAHEVNTKLDSNADPTLFLGIPAYNATPTPAQALTANLPNYEAVGVRYVVMPASGVDFSGQPWPPPTLIPRPSLVYRDKVAIVYRLASGAPLMSAGPGCKTAVVGNDQARVTCQAGSVLTRRELWMPGWSASVDGRSVRVRQAGGLFQSVPVPPGTSVVNFSFSPPFGTPALACLAVGLVAVLGGSRLDRLLARLRGRWRTTSGRRTARGAGERTRTSTPLGTRT